MADVLSTTANGKLLFPSELVTEMMNTVKGKSSLARMSAAEPVPFTGKTLFTFSLDKEIDVVAENGAKSKGGATVLPVNMVPVKVEYGARVSDEFDYASTEKKIDYLKQFADGCQRKIARGIDIMAMHGFNPRTGAASAVIGDNHLDKAVEQIVTPGTEDANAQMEAAIAMIRGSEEAPSGAIFAPAFTSSLAAIVKSDGNRMFPELAWGAEPGRINGLAVDTNPTVSFNSNKDMAIVGNFEEYFKWGYARDMEIEIIRYGNPDNDTTLGDLKGHNQIYMRTEAYIAWAILQPSAFSVIRAA